MQHMFGCLRNPILCGAFALAVGCATIETSFDGEPGLDAFLPGSTQQQVELQLGEPMASMHHRNGNQTALYYDHPVEYRPDPHKMITVRGRYDMLRLSGNPIVSVAHPDGTLTEYYGSAVQPDPVLKAKLDADRARVQSAFLRMMDDDVPGWWGTVVKPIDGQTQYLPGIVHLVVDKLSRTTGVLALPAWDLMRTVPGKRLVAITYGPDGRVRAITRASSGHAPGVRSGPSHTVAETIEVGKTPTDLAIAPDGRLVYVANHDSGTVVALDTSTHAVTQVVRLPGRPHGVAMTPDGARVYITDFVLGTVVVVSVAAKEVIATVPVGASPIRMAIAPDGQRIYVTNFHSQNVSVIDTTTHQVTSTVSVGAYPLGVTVTPNGRWVYVTNAGSNTVSVIDTATNRVSTTVSVGERPVGVAITPDGTRAYVTNVKSDTISVIDTAINRVLKTVEVGREPGGVRITADGRWAYVAYAGANAVSVIDTVNHRIVARVAVGSTPQEIALTRDGRRAYVSNAGSGTLSVLDVAGTPGR
jgi:YVTN family beta-propeller protein